MLYEVITRHADQRLRALLQPFVRRARGFVQHDGELVEQGRQICGAVSIPVFGDGDTGFGNAVNVKRTVEGYARAGFACVMIESYNFV